MDVTLSNALSGLNISSRKVKAAADNIAGANVFGSIPNGVGVSQEKAFYEPYRVEGSTRAGGGVAYTTRSYDPSYQVLYQPDAPYADENGNVAAPAVDLATELVSAKYAKADFLASAAVIRVQNELQDDLLDTLV